MSFVTTIHPLAPGEDKQVYAQAPTVEPVEVRPVIDTTPATEPTEQLHAVDATPVVAHILSAMHLTPTLVIEHRVPVTDAAGNIAFMADGEFGDLTLA